MGEQVWNDSKNDDIPTRRLRQPGHSQHLLTSLVADGQDVVVQCRDGHLPASRLVLAAISPTLRTYLEEYEDPCVILPHTKTEDMKLFFKNLTTPGNLQQYEEMLQLLPSLGCQVTTNSCNLRRAAQNLRLAKTVNWRETTLELVVQPDTAPDNQLNKSKDDNRESNEIRSFARFCVDGANTDQLNNILTSDGNLKKRVNQSIGRSGNAWTCQMHKCSYTNAKKVLVVYHVLAHLNVNAFKAKDLSYPDFVLTWRKKRSGKRETSATKKINDLENVDEIGGGDNDQISTAAADLVSPDPNFGSDSPMREENSTPPQDDQQPKEEEEQQQPSIQENKSRPTKRKKTASAAKPSRKKKPIDTMSEELKARCDEFIVFQQNTREYKCLFLNCNYSNRSKTSLKYHVMKHLNITEFLCEECGESFPLQAQLRKHVIAVHGSDQLRAAAEEWIVEDANNPTWFRCTHPQCGFAAATKKGAGLHALNQHMEKSFICDLCGQGFVTERSLVNHTNYHHNKSRSSDQLYPCSYCQKSFRTVSYLEAHEKEHRGVRPFQCDTCGKSFASNGMLRSHKFAHAPKIFKCDCCDQAFPRKNTLMVHLRAVHMHEKPYECDICGQKFPRSSSMTRHRRIHTGLPRYQCNYCDKTTTQRGDLNRHIAKAHGLPSRLLAAGHPGEQAAGGGLVTHLPGHNTHTIVNI